MALSSGRHRSSQTADQIDGGANCREIQPIGGADVAPQHCAAMQRNAEWQGGEAISLPGRVEKRHSGPRGGHGLERRVASAARRPARHRKDCEHAVAHELEHFAAKGVHGTGDAVEPGVERRNDRGRRGAFGEAP